MKFTRIFLFGLALIAAILIAIRLLLPTPTKNTSISSETSSETQPRPTSFDTPDSPDSSDYSQLSRRVAEIIVNGQMLEVEVATTSAEIVRGLSGRGALDLDGMLFVFPVVEKQNFWMKDMRFPIDLLWINDGKVVDILRNIPTPEPGTPDSELKTYASPGAVSHVLEFPTGAASDLGIEVSSEVITTDPSL